LLDRKWVFNIPLDSPLPTDPVLLASPGCAWERALFIVEQNMHKKAERRPRVGGFTGILMGAGWAAARRTAAVVFLLAWALGAVMGLVFGRLQRVGLNLADLAADALDAVGAWR
jgi:hypothetical protein